VLHRAALAAASNTLPSPKNGSLRQAAAACVQRLQADPALQMNTQTAKKATPQLNNFPLQHFSFSSKVKVGR